VTDKDYNMGHDVYSLGVCALEILRRGSFIQIQDNQYGEEGYRLSSEYMSTHYELIEQVDEIDNRDAAAMDMVMSDS
jgi:hypothetical protein